MDKAISSLDRIVVEHIKQNRYITIDTGKYAGEGICLKLEADKLLAHDIALAVQSFFIREHKRESR